MTAQSQSPWIVTATEENFQTEVAERSREVLVVVDFWATWCQPCRLLGPILEKLATEYQGKFVLVKAETERLPNLAAAFAVQSIPAVYGVRGGELVDYFVGLLPENQIRSWIDRLLPSPAETLVTEARALEATDAPAAEAKYRQAAELAPNLAQAKIGLASTLMSTGRPEESRQVMAELEARGFLEPEAEKVKAQLDLLDRGEHAGSLADRRAAVAANPDDLEQQLKLAEALAAAGQYDEALQTALALIQADRKKFGEPARKIMVDIFHLLPDDSDLTSEYRRKMSTALY